MKTSLRRLDQDEYICLGHTSSRRLEDILQVSLRRLEDLSARRLEKSWKTKNCYAEDVLKTSRRPKNDCWEEALATFPGPGT